MEFGENARECEEETAFTLGNLIAKERWVLLCGGKASFTAYHGSIYAKPEDAIARVSESGD